MKVLISLLLFIMTLPAFGQRISWESINGEKWAPIRSIHKTKDGNYFISTFTIDHNTGALFKSNSSCDSWEKLVIGNINYRARRVLSDEKYIYAHIINTSIYRSEDNGKNWDLMSEGLSSGLPYKPIIKDFIKSSNGIFFTFCLNEGIYYSNDSCKTWHKLGNSPSTSSTDLNCLSISQNDNLVLFNEKTPFVSSDYGKNWNKVNFDNGVEKIIYGFVNMDSIYVLSDQRKIYSAHILSDTLKLIKNNAFSGNVISANISENRNIKIFSSHGLYISDLIKDTTILSSNNYSMLFKNDNIELIGTESGELFKVDQNNQSVKLLNKDLARFSVNSFVQVLKNEVYVIIDSSEIFKSINNGKNWFEFSNIYNPASNLRELLVSSSNEIYLITYDNKVYILDRNSEIWKEVNTNIPEIEIIDIAFNPNDDLFVLSDKGIFRKKKNDSELNLIYSEIKSGIFQNRNNLKFTIVKDTNEFWIFDTDTEELSIINTGTKIPYRITSVVINSDEDIFLGTSGGGIYYSSDKGLSWSKKNSLLTKNIVKRILLTDNDELIAITKNSGLFYSNNKAELWENIFSNLGYYEVKKIILGAERALYCHLIGKGLFFADSLKGYPIEKISFWKDYPSYKKQNMNFLIIKRLQYSKDGKKIYAFSKRQNIFRILDSKTGELIKENFLGYDDIYEKYPMIDIAIHSNEKYLAIPYNRKNTYLYDIDKDSIIFTVNPSRGESSVMEHYVSNLSVVFDEKREFLITSAEEGTDVGFASTTSGINNYWDINTGEYLGGLNANRIKKFEKSRNENLLCFTHFKRYSEHGSDGYTDKNYTFRIHDFENNKIINLYGTEDLNQSYQFYTFSNDSKFAAASNKSTELAIFDIQEEKLAFKLEYKINTLKENAGGMKFSLNDRYLIAPINYDGSTKIFIWDLRTRQILDSIDTETLAVDWKLDISPDSTHFIAGNEKGELFLFKNELITGVEENKKVIEDIQFSISPNPAYDFLNIICDSNIQNLPDKIEIFDIRGVKVLEKEFSTRIDISSLFAGTYYIKLGNKYFLFVIL